MSGLTSADVAKLADLARIDLSSEEQEKLSSELDVILDAVAKVQEAGAADVPATSHPLPLVNVTREDVVRPGLNAEEALAGAPAAEENRFRVPRILDEE